MDTRPEYSERFTSSYFPAFQYKSFLESLEVSSVVKFIPLKVLSTFVVIS